MRRFTRGKFSLGLGDGRRRFGLPAVRHASLSRLISFMGICERERKPAFSRILGEGINSLSGAMEERGGRGKKSCGFIFGVEWGGWAAYVGTAQKAA